MSREVKKPKGVSGPIAFDEQGARWETIELPETKAERECFIAAVISNASRHFVPGESEPSWMPIDIVRQNNEADLDFTVQTAAGEKLMELLEFLPLHQLGIGWADVPREVDPREKAKLALKEVAAKSAHQGGDDRLLVIHATEQAFELDVFTIEIMRRELNRNPPKFDRVYYVSVDVLQQGPLSEIYPGVPFGSAGQMSDEELMNCRVAIPHPQDLLDSSSG